MVACLCCHLFFSVSKENFDIGVSQISVFSLKNEALSIQDFLGSTSGVRPPYTFNENELKDAFIYRGTIVLDRLSILKVPLPRCSWDGFKAACYISKVETMHLANIKLKYQQT